MNFKLIAQLGAESAQFDGDLHDAFDLGFCHQYPVSDFADLSVDASLSHPYQLATSMLQAINLFALKVRSGGPFTVLVTSSAGAEQAILVTDEILLHNPASPSALSSIKLVGTGEVAYAVAGSGATPTPPGPTPEGAIPFDCVVGVADRDAVYLASADTVGKASAASSATVPCIGFVVGMITPTRCLVRRDGELSGFALTPTAPYYLGVAPGSISLTPPVIPGQVFQRVGWARDASILNVEVDQDTIVVT